VRWELLICAATIWIANLAPASATPVHLRCEYLENPLGIESATPHLSWQSDNTEHDWVQSAYQILVASEPGLLRAGKPDIWDSGKIGSSDSVGIAYAGPAVRSRQRYYWKVRLWDKQGRVYESTEAAWWEMGLLNPADWKARWISWDNPDDEADKGSIRWIWAAGENALEVKPKTSVLFRTNIRLGAKPSDAALFVSARTQYEATVNGREVGRKSEWVSFDRCDITDQLVPGDNAIEIKVTSSVPDPDAPAQDAKPAPAGLAALVKITSADGSSSRRGTGTDWEARTEGSAAWSAAQIVGDLTDNRMGNPGALPQPASYLRKDIQVSDKIKSARLYVTALGSYYFFVNGNRVGSDALAPGFTDYRKRVLYQTYDVASLLAEGKNTLAAILGDGWYGSGLTWSGVHFFAPPDRLMAQLEIDYASGRRELFTSDNSWRAKASPILRSEIYAGELYDARLEQTGWATAPTDDSTWSRVTVTVAPAIAVSSQSSGAAQVVRKLAPKRVRRAADGSYVFDMGQNMVGWVSLKARGPAGTRVRMRFAEILKPDGTIYTQNLRNADATDTFVLRGGAPEVFTPHFTFHGFRYVEVTGYPGEPPLSALTGEVVSSVTGEPTATVVTSSDLVNKMWGIGLWGQRGNFLSIPTDCPQRDERLGWMGDAGVFWRTGAYNFDIASFSQKFVQDIVDAQTSYGGFTNVSPNTMPVDSAALGIDKPWPEDMVGAPGWGDAGVIVPWTTWVQYGNTNVILKNWEPMKRWMQFIEDRNPDFLRKKGLGPDYADWLAPDEHTDKELLATAYWALIAGMMTQMARATGNEADAKHYVELTENIRRAFQNAYISDQGVVGTGTQTSYVVALYTKMAPKELEPALVANLVKEIERRNWHLSTGFLGTPFLLFTLSDHGRDDVAYRLLLNDTYPSWGYMLTKGATTWWERWNGDTGDPGMNSYNHYAFGSVIAWVYRYLAGIDSSPLSPGFKNVIIRPHLDASVRMAETHYDSVYGRIATKWKNPEVGPFELHVTIPANSTADIYLPAKPGGEIFEGAKKLSATREGENFVLHVGSGAYDFEVR
jgi:alpha-L-rhamnosidase